VCGGHRRSSISPYERRLAFYVVAEFAHTQAEAKLRMLIHGFARTRSPEFSRVSLRETWNRTLDPKTYDKGNGSASGVMARTLATLNIVNRAYQQHRGKGPDALKSRALYSRIIDCCRGQRLPSDEGPQNVLRPGAGRSEMGCWKCVRPTVRQFALLL
jgi:hypothetical protein